MKYGNVTYLFKQNILCGKGNEEAIKLLTFDI